MIFGQKSCKLSEIDICLTQSAVKLQKIPENDKKWTELCEEVPKLEECIENYSKRCLSRLQSEGETLLNNFWRLLKLFKTFQNYKNWNFFQALFGCLDLYLNYWEIVVMTTSLEMNLAITQNVLILFNFKIAFKSSLETFADNSFKSLNVWKLALNKNADKNPQNFSKSFSFFTRFQIIFVQKVWKKQKKIFLNFFSLVENNTQEMPLEPNSALVSPPSPLS